MLPDRVSNPGPLTYESGALPIALRGPARASDMIRLRNMLMRVGDKTHQYLTPTVVLKHPPIHLNFTCSLVIELLSGAS